MDLMPGALALLVVLVMSGVVAAAWDIARRYEAGQVAYLNWFLLHFTIGGLGLTAVVLLAALGRITSEGVGALLGSVIAYSLGAATNRSAAGTQGSGKPDNSNPGRGTLPRPVVPVRPPGPPFRLPVQPTIPTPAAASPPTQAQTPGGADPGRYGPVPLVPR